MIILPRQARNKTQEKLKKREGCFLAALGKDLTPEEVSSLAAQVQKPTFFNHFFHRLRHTMVRQDRLGTQKLRDLD
jgi:hypothetical protein